MTKECKKSISSKEEHWKPIKNFDGYFISSLGRVMSVKCDYKKFLTLHFTKSGYLRAALYKNGRTYNRRVHRLVYEAFVGEIEDFEINHIDRNKQNNKISNLERVTHCENISHGWNTGPKMCNQKLETKDVLNIRKLIENGHTIKYISAAYNVSLACIYDIKSGRNWASI